MPHRIIRSRSLAVDGWAVTFGTARRGLGGLRYGDITIFKMALSAIFELFNHHTRPPRSLCCWPQLPVEFRVNLIHRSEELLEVFAYLA